MGHMQIDIFACVAKLQKIRGLDPAILVGLYHPGMEISSRGEGENSQYYCGSWPTKGHSILLGEDRK